MELVVYFVLFLFTALVWYFHVLAKSYVFGILASLIILVASAFVLADGIEYKKGAINTFNETTDTVTVTYQFKNLEETQPTVNLSLGLSLLGVGLFVMFINAMAGFSRKKKKGRSSGFYS